MTEDRSAFDNLMYRRVPQFVGMYIAATWLVIELGDWMTERFSLPVALTTYVFVAMLAMLPAVVLFAYNHGAPGKDAWTTKERVAIPLNAFLTVGVLYFMSPLLVVEAATETVRISDETGAIQEFEVARQGYHREIIGFFWQNESGNSDLDWLSYGLPLMLAHDMNRVSPVISVATPFGSAVMRSELRNRGYPSFLDEPQGLRVEIARDRRSHALITGRFRQVDGKIEVHVTLTDVASGNAIGSHSVTGNDWLTAVDEISAAVLNYLKVEPGSKQSDDPVAQHFSASLPAIKHYVSGQLALDIDNDYPQGIAEFQSAVAIDPEFAEASGDLSMTFYLSNDLESARAAVGQALKNTYRLSETSKFLLKANRYIFDGDFVRGERVIEIWTQVQPNSTNAFNAMATISRQIGTAESLQRAVAAYDRLLELDPTNFMIIREKAEVEQQRGDYAAAAGYMRTFLEQEPDSGDAHRQLAGVYQALGDLEAAQLSLEDAAILSDSPLESEIGLARLEARRGLFDEAKERLDGQYDVDLSPQQQVQLLTAQTEIAFVKGEIAKAIALMTDVNEVGKAFMPPMVRLIAVENEQAAMLALLGRTDEALAITDEITAQLQAPMDSYMNFTYAPIYDAANDRESYREIVQRTLQVQDQLPPVMQPFVAMQLAQVAIWDEDFETAMLHLDRATELLGQSLLQMFQDNLSTSSLHVMLAELYLTANAIDEAQARLDEILRAFPASAYAKLVYARLYLAQGDTEEAREKLNDAMEIWSDADDDYIMSQEAASLLRSL